MAFLKIDPEKLPKHFEYQEKEKFWDQEWQNLKLFEFQESSSKEIFSIDTPPPTVSGSLHIGHIFSYTQTDVIARFQRMIGKNVFYPIGWDDNGLPTERRVQNMFHIRCDATLPYEKNLEIQPASAKDKKEKQRAVSRGNFIEICQKLTQEDEKTFLELFRRIGLSVDWREEYSTINDHCRKLAQYSFLDLFEKNLVYSLEAPTMWDVDFQTAVAQAEVEDRMTAGAYHHIRFGVDDSTESFVIATTRPELLPACVAVTAHPDDSRYKHLFGKKAVTPAFFAPVEIFPSELVDPEKGTGILMVCTFGDATDVVWWREKKLALRQVLNSSGCFDQIRFGSGNFPSLRPDVANSFYENIAGRYVKQARSKIIEILKDPSSSSSTPSEAPLQGEPSAIQHAVKFYEKGDRPLEYITTRQWFVRLMQNKEKLLEMGEKIQWHPNFMKTRFRNWTENLQIDWCISRQRYFGVPFPVWYGLDENAKPDFSKIYLPHKDQLPIDPMTSAPTGFDESQRNQANGFTGDLDVFDTWFTSSLTPQIGSGWINDPKRHAELFPMSMRPQAHEIIRTWAFYTIAKALLHENTIPWKDIAISGWILDPDRKKMSKSQGNVVTPMHLIEEYGADAIRYWSSSARLGVDTTFDEKVFKIGRRLVTKIFNASKFVLSQEGSEAPISNAIDQSFLFQLRALVTRATSAMNEFNYAQSLQETERFFWNYFTDTYIELVKNRAKNTSNLSDQNSAVTTLRFSLKVLLRLFAPTLPYICDEVWSWSFAKETGLQSVHQATWPDLKDFQEIAENQNSDSFLVAMECMNQIHKFKTENQISIGTGMNQLKIIASPNDEALLKLALGDLRAATRIENIEITANSDLKNLEFRISSHAI
ncbi:MAG: valine--tRNA ligase [Bdellovibrionota bacterium]